MLAVAGVPDPVVGEGLLGVGRLAVGDVGQALVDPLLQEAKVRAHAHVVFVDDLLRRIAIGQHGVEVVADLPHARRDRVAFDAEMQVPVHVEIAVEIGPHQRTPGIAARPGACRRTRDLLAIHRLVEIGRDGGHVDALAPVVRPALLQPLQEDGDAVFRRGLPGLAQHAPQIVGQGILLGEFHVDHRQRQPLAFVGGDQEVRQDHVLDIGGIELLQESAAQPRDRRVEILGAERCADAGRVWLRVAGRIARRPTASTVRRRRPRRSSGTFAVSWTSSRR